MMKIFRSWPLGLILFLQLKRINAELPLAASPRKQLKDIKNLSNAAAVRYLL